LVENSNYIDEVRRFNRFYTQEMGVLVEGLLDTPFSLSEARILYEIAHDPTSTAGKLRRLLGIDAGYMSRIVKCLSQEGLLKRTPSIEDRREQILTLTEKGKSAYQNLNERSHAEIAAKLAELTPEEQSKLVEAMSEVHRLLDRSKAPQAPLVLRPHRHGDMGWVVERHGAIYSKEFGWSDRFEGLVAEIVSNFLRDYDPQKERCWIAERSGVRLGCVFVVKGSDELAKLRLLLVEPSARGQGLGRILVDECIRYARQVGYRKMTLWTNSVLTSARRIYEATGFRLVEEKKHRDFGPELVGQNWERNL
jgi:DNA-binding MarR family transcriptional regulator/GNAT superfamily N-acetyltransferase